MILRGKACSPRASAKAIADTYDQGDGDAQSNEASHAQVAAQKQYLPSAEQRHHRHRDDRHQYVGDSCRYSRVLGAGNVEPGPGEYDVRVIKDGVDPAELLAELHQAHQEQW